MVSGCMWRLLSQTELWFKSVKSNLYAKKIYRGKWVCAIENTECIKRSVRQIRFINFRCENPSAVTYRRYQKGGGYVRVGRSGGWNTKSLDLCETKHIRGQIAKSFNVEGTNILSAKRFWMWWVTWESLQTRVSKWAFSQIARTRMKIVTHKHTTRHSYRSSRPPGGREAKVTSCVSMSIS